MRMSPLFTLKGQVLLGSFNRRLPEKRLNAGIGQHVSLLQGTSQHQARHRGAPAQGHISLVWGVEGQGRFGWRRR